MNWHFTKLLNKWYIDNIGNTAENFLTIAKACRKYNFAPTKSASSQGKASEVTTLWRYRNECIIIILINTGCRLTQVELYNGWNTRVYVSEVVKEMPVCNCINQSTMNGMVASKPELCFTASVKQCVRPSHPIFGVNYKNYSAYIQHRNKYTTRVHTLPCHHETDTVLLLVSSRCTHVSEVS